MIRWFVFAFLAAITTYVICCASPASIQKNLITFLIFLDAIVIGWCVVPIISLLRELQIKLNQLSKLED